MHVNPCGKSGEWRWIGDPAANLIWRRGALRRGDSTETETEDERPKMRREEWRKYADHYRVGKGKLLQSVVVNWRQTGSNSYKQVKWASLWLC